MTFGSIQDAVAGADPQALPEQWEVYGSLRSHLDCVRSVCMAGQKSAC
jgi:hypothetical protein